MQASTDKGMTSGPFGRQDPSLPQVFGRYLLVQRLSRGGMGEIFLAKHGLAGFEKLAVIKKVLPNLAADAQFISRFVDEAQVAIKLQHVNVAQVFEVGRVGDEYFLALEYVEGRDLRRTLALLGHRKQRLPPDLALFIGRELANGLAYAHRRTGKDGASLNLVHCDISPPNVVVSFEGETKVIDFGIAKSAIRGTATDPKMGFGKFGYMAPEQLIRGGIVDHRTDIYAAGVVLYELITGERLYEAGPEPDYRALAKKVSRGEHALPSEIDPMLAPYDDLVATALRPRAEDRYQTAAEFRDAIQQCLVAVNPTISTDQLGSYMRELFADEMTAQRELHERVARVHVSDFQEAFHTQTISTVSFAFAQLPLQAPPEDRAPPARPKRPTAPTVVTTPAPPGPSDGSSGPLAAPPAPAHVAEDLSLADGTGTSVRTIAQPRSRRGLVIAAGAAVVLVAAVAFAMSRGGGEDPPPAQGPAPVAVQMPVVAPPPPKPIVEEIHAAGSDEIEMPVDSAPQQHKRETRKTTPPPRDPHKATPATPPPAAVTRSEVGAKFRAAKREYDAYKEKNGMRLDSAWNDLATFVQFQSESNLEEASRRVDAFRAKLHD